MALSPIKMIAIDLDGTLLRSDGTLSPRTRAALDGALAAGIVVVLVTARPPRTVQALAREFGLQGLAICTNGALVYDLTNESVVREVALESTIARQIILALRTMLPGSCFALRRAYATGKSRSMRAIARTSKERICAWMTR